MISIKETARPRMYLMVLCKLCDPSRMNGFPYQWHGDKGTCPSHRSVMCFFFILFLEITYIKKLFSVFSLKSFKCKIVL